MTNSALSFLLFYMIFFGFTFYITTLAGITILEIEGNNDMTGLIPKDFSEFINPLFFLTAAWTLFNISSEYAIIYLVLIVPFLIGIVYIIAAWVRGVSP